MSIHTLSSGWNLVSSMGFNDSFETLANDSNAIISIYKYGTGGYASLDKNLPLDQGQGYWLLALNSSELNDSNTSVDHQNDPATISITSGWNLVGTPFNADINVNDLFSENLGSLQSIYQYGANGYQQVEPSSGTLEQGKGYWLLSNNDFIVQAAATTKTYDEINDSNIHEAVGEWFSNNTAASEKYGDISTWDTSKVQDMNSLFQNRNTFNDDISGWNTHNVTDMSSMFRDATNFNGPLTEWNTHNVSYMYAMFRNAGNFNQPLNEWNTHNVSTMYYMFRNAGNFNQPLNEWNTHNVTYMDGMFDYATSFNQPLNNWNTHNVSSMYSMFENATNFNGSLNEWKTHNVTAMRSMFKNANDFAQDITMWNDEKVSDADNMFTDATTWLLNYENNDYPESNDGPPSDWTSI